MVKKNPELLPKVEHPELLPKVEPTLAKDVNKKKRKKKNPQKPILIYVDADVNPIIDAQKSIVINQALQKSAIKANPEPVPILTAVKSKKRKRKKSKTTVPVDAAKKVKVDAEPEPILTAVKSKKRKRKKSKTTVPVDAANQVDVAAQVGAAGQEDAAKKVKVDAELEPILTAVKSKKRKKKKSKTRAPVDAPEPILKAVKSKKSKTKAVKSNKSKTKAVKSKKSKTKAVKSKKSKTTAAKKIDAAKNVEGPKYVEICVICRKKGHLIPTCPELNEKIVPNPNHNTEQKKESGKKGSARPQPPQDVKMRKGQEDRLLVTGCALQVDPMAANTLVIANCEVVKPRVAAAEHISQFNEEARSPFVKKYKTIIHPGEINRIRELPQNTKIVATHTDSPDVLIWDVEAQPNRHAVLGATSSRPDLILTGHQDNAEFALAMCPTEPYVLSGGKDKTVVLWSIQDHISAATTDPAATKSQGSGGSIIKQNSKPGDGNDKAADGPSVAPRGIYYGHEDTVEDVAFCPSSSQEFCSVGDDSCLILWDARVGSSPAIKVEKAHNADLHCVDWNPHDDNLILTGSADNSVRLFDRRNLTSGGVGAPIYKFEGHKAAVLCVQWCPDKSSVFGSSAEDGLLNIWDYEKVSKERTTKGPSSPPGLFFQHAGHRDKVVDFHWNASDPWTIVSVSDDCDTTGGGGTLQIWRMSDLIYRPEEEVLAELEKFKSHVVSCASKP